MIGNVESTIIVSAIFKIDDHQFRFDVDGVAEAVVPACVTINKITVQAVVGKGAFA